MPVAAVVPVAMAHSSSSTTAAVAPQLSRNEKLRKVLRELHADALSRLDSVAIDAEVPAELARGVPSYACPVADADRLDARTDWAAQQSADTTISRVIQLLNANARPDANELEANPSLKSLVDVWSQLVVENALLKHCNERAISTRIVVPAVRREEVFRALHEPAHHGYQATLRRIAQRFWWPRPR